MKFNFPKWVISHVPHDSTHIPYDIRNQFILSTESLQKESVKMTDFWTLALYSNGIPVEQTVVSPISRLEMLSASLTTAWKACPALVWASSIKKLTILRH